MIRSLAPPNPKGKYTQVFFKMLILLVDIWQRLDAHTMFLLSLAECYEEFMGLTRGKMKLKRLHSGPLEGRASPEITADFAFAIVS